VSALRNVTTAGSTFLRALRLISRPVAPVAFGRAARHA
jgi:hypothetical protein